MYDVYAKVIAIFFRKQNFKFISAIKNKIVSMKYYTLVI